MNSRVQSHTAPAPSLLSASAGFVVVVLGFLQKILFLCLWLCFPSILCPVSVEVPDCVWVCFVLGCTNFVPGRARVCSTNKCIFASRFARNLSESEVESESECECRCD